MTAAMLCGIAGIEQRILENSAAYLKTWLARFKSDSRLLVSAASQAQKAADFIQGKAPHRLAEASLTQGFNGGLVG
jgi:antirestriction protein ArdC